MPASKTYTCPHPNCKSEFTRIAELRKHKVHHVKPESVFRCTFPSCGFTTLQKKNLSVHSARHTGEKRYLCPETLNTSDLSSGDAGSLTDSSIDGQPCSFRTNDPAALTRHRKAVHGYIPKARGRAAQNKAPVKRVTFAPSCKAGDTSDSDASSYNAAEPPRALPMLDWKGEVWGIGGQSSDSASASSSDENSAYSLDSFSSVHASSDTDVSFAMDVVEEESMEEAEEEDKTYWSEVRRLEAEYLVMELDERDIFFRGDDREYCLCPEWMVEAGVEGWETLPESVLVQKRGEEYLNSLSH
ncbi:hypothetical protein F5I97DRAFT_9287 [Phlebopus sp. FC_14]|nr:hypothetical protein F5I97DRAFT_9287 [Phlebopus sp. FC_14]